MKIICSKTDLTKGVTSVSRAVPSRTTMPILVCILLDASENEITMTATDTDLGIETKIAGKTEEAGTIAVDAKVFSEIVRKLPDSDVVIETDDSHRMIILCEKAKFNIVGKDGDEFPALPVIEKESSVTLSEYTLKEVIQQTIFSVADSSENNKMMTGELFEITENRLRVASLDGHRISIRNVEMRESYDSEKVIVPGKSLQELSRILPGETENNVEMYFTKNHVLFEFGETRVISRLIDGEYFHIEQMLSTDYETKITINKKEFLDCIERATLLVREGDKKPVIINVEDGYMELRINSFIGSMDEEIEIEKEGKEIMIGFNPKFLIDALRVIEEETVTLYLINAKAPCFIRDAANTYIYLILPVNFNAATV